MPGAAGAAGTHWSTPPPWERTAAGSELAPECSRTGHSGSSRAPSEGLRGHLRAEAAGFKGFRGSRGGAGGPSTRPSSRDPGLGGPPLRVPQEPKRPPLGSRPGVSTRQPRPTAKAGRTRRPLWLCCREAAWSQAHLAPGSRASLPGHAVAVSACQRQSALMRLPGRRLPCSLAGGSGCRGADQGHSHPRAHAQVN